MVAKVDVLHRWVFQLLCCNAVCIQSVGVVADASSFDQSKRLRTGGDYTHTGYASPSPFHPPPPPPVWGHQG